jgi:hypothetical protein
MSIGSFTANFVSSTINFSITRSYSVSLEVGQVYMPSFLFSLDSLLPYPALGALTQLVWARGQFYHYVSLRFD